MKSIFTLIFVAVVTVSLNAQYRKEPSINVMSYNIRLNIPQDGVNAWPNRKEWVSALIKFYDTDILCIQEGLPEQVDYLESNTGFYMEGVGRDDGKRKGEFSAIFYNKYRFAKKDGGTFWLSETPEQPSKGWDAAIVRICTWIKLYDKNSRKEFFVFNTHYDHKGEVARVRSSELIKKKITEIAGKFPVLLTGDLNVTPEMPAAAVIRTLLDDAKDVSKEPAYGPEGSFNEFNFLSELKNRIDYIFVSKKFEVFKFAVLSDSKHQRYPSDHLPVFSKLKLK